MITKEYLNNLGIYELRELARQKGVASPTHLKRAEIIQQIMEIEKGKLTPKFNTTKRGRPTKKHNIPSDYCNCPAYISMVSIFNLLEEPLNKLLNLIELYKDSLLKLDNSIKKHNPTDNKKC